MRALVDYFRDVTHILLDVDPAAEFVTSPLIEGRDNQRGDLALALRYSDGSRLYVNLQSDCSGDWVLWGDYGFQYLDPDGTVRFRYDNAPHHRHLPNFPHHLHLSTGAILPLGPPNIRGIARAVRWHLDHPGMRWAPEPT